MLCRLLFNMTTLEPSIKTWHLSSFYREAVEGAVSYNSQLVQDRSSRLPYLDAQTGIAQVTSPLLRSRLERRRGVAPGQLFSYPPRRWRRETKPNPLFKKGILESVCEPMSQQGSSPGLTTAAAGLIQTVEGKRSSRLATISRAKDSTDGFLAPVSGVRPSLSLESPGSSELNEEEESPEPDIDYMEEYDSEEEKKQKRKKRPPPKIRGSSTNNNVTSLNTRTSKGGESDKPFLCNLCNRRYKTVASLKAHRTQYHGGEPHKASPSAPPLPTTPLAGPPPGKAEVRVPVVLPPPPNLNGKEDAKPSPYCDFCLGDSTCNRKTSKAEKMVSCANCGRSAHPSCMQFSDSLSTVVHTYRWQCIECKSCHFCGTSENDDQLLFCDDCDRGYHMYCLRPPLKNPPEGNWTCGMCFKIAL